MPNLPTLQKTPFDSLLYNIDLTALLNSTGAGTILGTPTISADRGNLEFGPVAVNEAGQIVQVRISGGDEQVGYQRLVCLITLYFYTTNVPDQLQANMNLELVNVL